MLIGFCTLSNPLLAQFIPLQNLVILRSENFDQVESYLELHGWEYVKMISDKDSERTYVWVYNDVNSAQGYDGYFSYIIASAGERILMYMMHSKSDFTEMMDQLPLMSFQLHKVVAQDSSIIKTYHNGKTLIKVEIISHPSRVDRYNRNLPNDYSFSILGDYPWYKDF